MHNLFNPCLVNTGVFAYSDSPCSGNIGRGQPRQ